MAFDLPKIARSSFGDLFRTAHVWADDQFAYIYLGVIIGLASYLRCHYREPSLRGFLMLLALCQVLQAGIFIGLGRHRTPYGAFQAIIVYNIVLSITFGTSLVVYRLFLNPLRSFPGPILARLSKGAAVWEAIDGNTHLWLETLHKQYGDVVRVAPNELSYCNVESITEIHGAQSSKIAKGPWYDGVPNVEVKSMATERDLAEHKYRRRIWDRGFSPKALVSYEPRIQQHTNTLSKQLRARAGEVINFSEWCDYFAFDVMGDLGFGEDFHMLVEAKPHPYMVFMHQSLRLLTILGHVPWMKTILPWAPVDAQTKRDGKDFVRISAERFQKRRKEGSNRADVFSYLLADNVEVSRKLTDAELEADAGTVIVGGADTTAVCLTFLFYLLVKNPETLRRLQEEVDELWDGSTPQTGALWAQAKYLNGAINESLRLYPPGPNGMQRTTPKGGCFILGEYLPEGTQLSVHGWSIHRDERYFSNPTEFVPERWIDEKRPKDFRHETRAFIPFSVGQYGCVGKGLALLEMRFFVAELVKRFDISLDISHDEEAFQRAVRSNLALLKGRLPLIFTERAGK
ncbi:hypothetical protein Z517_03560 [Fonsecaea pedrosoi CBS 271.37]|uniref:Unplaced genomic scaffold supercont1.2, whole genome shotgun sequence n=1 Tax=Fonsecaea pedrosoi CBS 271.37 TaxID=1442368 RepID=A0A0D2H0A3_9EURO|nr:uncharacterized protein Z517_03560 [Fonsecaea pedrosoi CBS 271.37]KIW84310.1 hypothetical protein Z517_03560 [Fonsecaea pedrosoi CBS 271.37]